MDVVEKLNHYLDIEEGLVVSSTPLSGPSSIASDNIYIVASAENIPLGESDDFGTFIQIGGCNRKLMNYSLTIKNISLF